MIASPRSGSIASSSAPAMVPGTRPTSAHPVPCRSMSSRSRTTTISVTRVATMISVPGIRAGVDERDDRRGEHADAEADRRLQRRCQHDRRRH